MSEEEYKKLVADTEEQVTAEAATEAGLRMYIRAVSKLNAHDQSVLLSEYDKRQGFDPSFANVNAALEALYDKYDEKDLLSEVIRDYDDPDLVLAQEHLIANVTQEGQDEIARRVLKSQLDQLNNEIYAESNGTINLTDLYNSQQIDFSSKRRTDETADEFFGYDDAVNISSIHYLNRETEQDLTNTINTFASQSDDHADKIAVYARIASQLIKLNEGNANDEVQTKLGDVASLMARPDENSDGGDAEIGSGGIGGVGEYGNTEGLGSGDSGYEGSGDGGPGGGGGGGGHDSAAKDEPDAGQMPVTPEPIIPATVVSEPASDTEDASAYIDNILDEPAINSISKNPHYLSLPFRHESEPLPEWSFSVDFVPISSYFDNARLADMFTILTKAVISVTINELKANTSKLMYAGLQHPFVTNMNTAGDLHIKFAENERFTISNILRKIYRWCSHDPEFAVYDLSVTHTDDQTEPKGMPYTSNTNPIFDKFVCDIVVNVYPPEIAHAFNNSDEILHPAFIYTYKNCWLKSIAQFALDYDSDEMIDRDAVFTYQYVLSEDWASYVDRTHLNSDTSEVEGAAVQTPEQEPSTWEKFKSAISFEDPYLERGADKSATEKAKGFISPFGDVIGAVGNVFTGEN